jgi:hypothetical protein
MNGGTGDIEDIKRRREDMTFYYLRVVKTIFYERKSE